MRKKTILFLSANDFKEKSIQVIRKTPIAYEQRGWNVTYIVMRDTATNGNYYYEDIINPDGIKVIRFNMCWLALRNKITNGILHAIITKLASFIGIIQLVIRAKKILKKNEISIIYGYETHGVLASMLLKLMVKRNKYKFINRFMGTWMTDFYDKKKYLKILLNFDQIIALRAKSDLLIFTNCGVNAARILTIIKSKSLNVLKYWVNGVDEQKLPKDRIAKLKQQMDIGDEIIFTSICRLVDWKRIDRTLDILAKLKHKNFKYVIVGDGHLTETLKKQAKQLKIDKNVIFIGAVNNDQVKKYLNIADIFISMADLSNVGNPLLEAIRCNKIIFTLNNGETANWIKHKQNGFIYDINDDMIGTAAADIDQLINDKVQQKTIIENIKITEKQKLWTWQERLDTEVKLVEKLLYEDKI